MTSGLWHQAEERRRSRLSAAKVGAVLGAGLPLGLAAATLLARRRRDADRRGGSAPTT